MGLEETSPHFRCGNDIALDEPVKVSIDAKRPDSGEGDGIRFPPMGPRVGFRRKPLLGDCYGYDSRSCYVAGCDNPDARVDVPESAATFRPTIAIL